MAIVLNGNLSDWSAADRLEKTGTTVAGYEIYGRFEGGKYLFAVKGPDAIGANSTFWLNTDRNSSSGYQVFTDSVGAEYHIEFDAGGVPRLYSSTTSTLVEDLVFSRSADGTIIEFELTAAQLGDSVGGITFAADINNGVFLPASYAGGGYSVFDPVANPLDGQLTEWSHAARIDTPVNAQVGYEVYASAADGTFQLALKSDIKIGQGTTFWLNTDNNAATGTNVFGNPTGSDYRIEVDGGGIARLYAGAGTTPLATLNSMLGPDEKTIEVSLPKALVGNTGRLDIVLDVNQQVFVPGDYATLPALTFVDTTTTQPPVGDHRVAIVYSETTAAKFFSAMAYSQLFMAAQSQAMAAGIPFDVISETDLTDLTLLSKYDAIVFPSFSHVPANYQAITDTLTRLVYDYDVSLITAGDFMTNAASGAALDNAYARMDLLFGLERVGGATGTIELVAGAGGHPVTEGYAPGSVIRTYDQFNPSTSFFAATNAGYSPTTTIASQVVNNTTHDAVIGTTTGARNVHFATDSLLGDNNLLGKALDWVMDDPSGPSISLHMSRNSSIVASRNDMDQSQEAADVDGVGTNNVGIYDVLLPILQQWKTDFNFVGSYYVNVGANPPDQETNWLISKPYYDLLRAMGNEIGSHSYTHPSDTNFLAGLIDTEEELDAFAALYNLPGNVDADPTIGSQLTGMNLADYQAALSRGLAATDLATLSALDKAILLTTFRFQFETSRQALEAKLGYSIGGAAVPGMPEGLQTAREILEFYDYLSGGASLVGAGYPGAFGYLSATEDSKIYLAPNMSFDFTLLGWQNLTVEQAKAAWTAEWNAINANSDLPVAVWPWHDYGPTEWVIDAPNPSDYRLEMFTHFIQTAYASGAEFVTLADLAARMATFEKADFSFTTAGDVITATATPHGGTVGTFALNLDDLAGKEIKSVANWYAYDGDSVFLDADGGQFQITLGATADDVTHITSLDSRMKLISLTGDGDSLNFQVEGEGLVKVALKDYLGNPFTVNGATVVSQVGDVLTLKLPSIGTHNVSVALVNAAPTAIDVSDQILLQENTPTRTKVATVAVADTDIDPRLRNNLVSVSDDRFIFDQTDGGLYLQAGKTVDYEAGATIDLVLSTGVGGAITKNVQLVVGDVNDTATDIVVTNQITLQENTAARTKIADLAAIDPDAAPTFRNNVLTVSDNRFEVSNGSLYLKAGQIVDYESSPSISLLVQAKDGSLAFEKSVSLAVSNVQENNFSPAAPALAEFGANAGWSSDNRFPRQLADVNGDGNADIVGFANNGVYVSLADGQGGFSPLTFALSEFGPNAGWSSDDRFPRQLADVNGDGKADIVGFANNGVYVSLANGQGGFSPLTFALAEFGPNAGWSSDDRFPRQLGDVNGDGKADIVGFANNGVYVSLADGQGGFSPLTFALAEFGPNAGWSSDDRFPRQLGDVNGDGRADIVGFANNGVYVSLADGQGGFSPLTFALSEFGPNAGWSSDDRFPRQLADVNGDGKADIVGFANNGVYAALANGQGGFNQAVFALDEFGVNASWISDDRSPRQLGDVNGDGMADVVGFGENGIQVALASDWFM